MALSLRAQEHYTSEAAIPKSLHLLATASPQYAQRHYQKLGVGVRVVRGWGPFFYLPISDQWLLLEDPNRSKRKRDSGKCSLQASSLEESTGQADWWMTDSLDSVFKHTYQKEGSSDESKWSFETHRIPVDICYLPSTPPPGLWNFPGLIHGILWRWSCHPGRMALPTPHGWQGTQTCLVSSSYPCEEWLVQE